MTESPDVPSVEDMEPTALVQCAGCSKRVQVRNVIEHLMQVHAVDPDTLINIELELPEQG